MLFQLSYIKVQIIEYENVKNLGPMFRLCNSNGAIAKQTNIIVKIHTASLYFACQLKVKLDDLEGNKQTNPF